MTRIFLIMILVCSCGSLGVREPSSKEVSLKEKSYLQFKIEMNMKDRTR